ncbi:unnamed protein product, partial [Rotaria magnacalcarata]
EIIVSSLRLKSIEDSAIYSAPCEARTKISTHTSETILLNRFDCHDSKANS